MWKQNKGLWQDDRFPVYHFTSTSNFKDLKNNEIRDIFLSKNKIYSKDLVRAQQVHGKKIRIVTDKDKGKELPKTDGLITDNPGVYLAIFTADCMPVFFADKKKEVVGLVHAGWRGLKAGIIPEAVKIFKKKFKIKAKDISVFIGPHIQKCCFKIGDEIKKEFSLKKTQDSLSLSDVAEKQLKKTGIKITSINEKCTCHEKTLFFSYRRDKTPQRLMSLIGIKKKIA
ncbi:MAG: peptidoglycan editing factor PgeF [Elusimicrobia bacterium]|nr:peptidoglycan editing factor PgeF [Candidatus Liberimonas magnetica]